MQDSMNAPVRAEALMRALTDEQRAFAADPAPAVCCIAAAGAGKTSALAARVIHLLRFRGVEPRRIRVFVFTRAAREDIARRVADVLGGEVARAVDVTTFHAFAARLTLKETPTAELASEQLSETYLRSLYEGPLRRRGLPGISEVRDGIVDYEADRWEDDDVRRAVGILLGRMEETGAIPLWDLLPRCDAVLEDAAAAAAWSVDHVLVDEAQDVTRREERIARRVGRFIAAVGDPRQDIMGFRGACGFCALKPYDSGPDEAHHWLTRSFRFGPAIADFANRIAAADGFPKPTVGVGESRLVRAWTDPHADAIEHLRGAASAAVLCRTHDECEAAALELAARGLPVHYAGRAEDRGEGVDPLKAPPGHAVVATIHAAKGREWDAVYLPPSAHWPQNREELGVAYVAVTRARRVLVMGANRLEELL